MLMLHINIIPAPSGKSGNSFPAPIKFSNVESVSSWPLNLEEAFILHAISDTRPFWEACFHVRWVHVLLLPVLQLSHASGGRWIHLQKCINCGASAEYLPYFWNLRFAILHLYIVHHLILMNGSMHDWHSISISQLNKLVLLYGVNSIFIPFWPLYQSLSTEPAINDN